MPRPISFVVAPALVALMACSTDGAPKQPLGTSAAAPASAPDSAASVSAVPGLSPAAREALDAGNDAYRAKKFELAITRYREAAVAAPTHAAPWFGVFMAANSLKNTALADSAMVHVKALSADASDLEAHTRPTTTAPTGPLPPGHPSTATPLPPGHPSTATQLPPGHPAPVKKPK